MIVGTGMHEIDVLIAVIAITLLYTDIWMYFRINGTLKGWLKSWKNDIMKLVSR